MAEEQVGIVPFSELHRTGGIYSVPCMMGVLIIRVLSQRAAIEVLCSSGVPQFTQVGRFEGSKRERRRVWARVDNLNLPWSDVWYGSVLLLGAVGFPMLIIVIVILWSEDDYLNCIERGLAASSRISDFMRKTLQKEASSVGAWVTSWLTASVILVSARSCCSGGGNQLAGGNATRSDEDLMLFSASLGLGGFENVEMGCGWSTS